MFYRINQVDIESNYTVERKQEKFRQNVVYHRNKVYDLTINQPI